MNSRQTSVTIAYLVIGTAVLGRGALPARVLNWARSQPLPLQGSGATAPAAAPAQPTSQPSAAGGGGGVPQ